MTTFRAVILTVALSLPVRADFCLTADPLPLKASELALGTGREYGLWSLRVRPLTLSGNPSVISQEEIAERFPHPFLFEWQARDILDRRANGSSRTRKRVYLDMALRLAPIALAATGFATGTDWLTWSGVGLSAGNTIAGRVAAAAPNPEQTKAHLLPDSGIPGSAPWSGVVVTGLVRGAKRVGPVCNSAVKARGTVDIAPSSGPFCWAGFDENWRDRYVPCKPVTYIDPPVLDLRPDANQDLVSPVAKYLDPPVLDLGPDWRFVPAKPRPALTLEDYADPWKLALAAGEGR